MVLGIFLTACGADGSDPACEPEAGAQDGTVCIGQTGEGEPGPVAESDPGEMAPPDSNPDPIWMEPDRPSDPDPPPPPPSDPRTALEDRVLDLVNEVRASGTTCGGQTRSPVGAVQAEPRLRAAARGHSEDMGIRDYFAHEDPDGVGPGERVSDTGYMWRAVGENIAAGYDTPEAVMQGWLESPGHCNNIMNGSFTELGVGYAEGNGGRYGRYWTQKFARP